MEKKIFVAKVIIEKAVEKDGILHTAKGREKLVDTIARTYSLAENLDINAEDICVVTYDDEKIEVFVDADNKSVLVLEKCDVITLSAEDIETDVKNNVTTYLNYESSLVRAFAVSLGYGLEQSMDDSPAVVVQIVRKGYKLDVLKNHANPYVRAEVALQGAYLEELVDDSDCHVRAAVAKVAEDEEILNKLCSFNEDRIVKNALADRDINAKMFCCDTEVITRIHLAENTLDNDVLDVLLQDESDKVRDAAFKNISINETDCLRGLEVNEDGTYINNRYIRMTIAKKAIENGWIEVLNILCEDGAEEVRMLLAESGVFKDFFLKDKVAAVRKAAYLAEEKEIVATEE